MSIIIICFSGSPQVTPEALQREAKLEQLVDLKVKGYFFSFSFSTLTHAITEHSVKLSS